MCSFSLNGILGRLAMHGVAIDSPRIDPDTQRFLKACRNPELGVATALDHFQKANGRAFVLTFLTQEGVELSSHLVESASDLRTATTFFEQNPNAARIKVGSNQHTARR